MYQKLKSDKDKKLEARFYNQVKDMTEFFPYYDPATFEPFKRYELEEIYIRVSDGWLCKTYSREMGLHLRAVKFKILPFQWGFALEQLSSVDENKREKQIHSVNSIDELIDVLKNFTIKKSAISVKGTGLVSVHRIIKLLEQQNSGK